MCLYGCTKRHKIYVEIQNTGYTYWIFLGKGYKNTKNKIQNTDDIDFFSASV